MPAMEGEFSWFFVPEVPSPPPSTLFAASRGRLGSRTRLLGTQRRTCYTLLASRVSLAKLSAAPKEGSSSAPGGDGGRA